MGERLAPPFERKSDRPLLKDAETHARGRVHVAEHEFTHIVAIWGVGKSVKKASVVPTSEYLGVTIPGERLSASQMQIAAMASADHDGNGSDQMKAWVLQHYGGIDMDQAAAIANGIISSYRQEVLHVAAIYLAAEGSADEAMLRKFLRWAEEEVKDQEDYRDKPLSSWSDELEKKRDEYFPTEEEHEPAPIYYLSLDRAEIANEDGEKVILCRFCLQVDGHTPECQTSKPSPEFKRSEYVIFSASEHTDYFSRIDTICL